jgi:hypothetical protein
MKWFEQGNEMVSKPPKVTQWFPISNIPRYNEMV